MAYHWDVSNRELYLWVRRRTERHRSGTHPSSRHRDKIRARPLHPCMYSLCVCYKWELRDRSIYMIGRFIGEFSQMGWPPPFVNFEYLRHLFLIGPNHSKNICKYYVVSRFSLVESRFFDTALETDQLIGLSYKFFWFWFVNFHLLLLILLRFFLIVPNEHARDQSTLS